MLGFPSTATLRARVLSGVFAVGLLLSTGNAEPGVRQILDLDEPVKGGFTTLWSPGFQRCWDELREMFDLEKINLETPASKSLDAFEWDAAATLPKGSSIAVVGEYGVKFADQANRMMAAAFGLEVPFLDREQWREQDGVVAGGLACLTAMKRQLVFEIPFEVYPQPRPFQATKGKTLNVHYFGSFGVHRSRHANTGWVLAYEPGERLALRLRVSETDEAMFLLMDERVQTIGEAIAQTRNLGGNARKPEAVLDADDTVMIPMLSVSDRADFLSDLNGSFRSEKAPVDLRFNAALQSIDLKLNEKGADMETRSFLIPPSFLAASAEGGVPVGGGIERKLVFDRPFYLMLWRKGGTHPYLAAHVVHGGLVTEK